MRTINYTSRFKRDDKWEKAGQHGKQLEALLTSAVDTLAIGQPLPRRTFDHALGGKWRHHRNRHIKPDLASYIVSQTVQLQILSGWGRLVNSTYTN